MSAAALLALLPILVLAAAVVGVMLLVAFYRRHHLATGASLAGLGLALAALPLAARAGPQQVTPLLVIDPYALFYMGLVFAASLAVAVLSYAYLEGRAGHAGEFYHGEFYILLLLATLGAAVLVASSHFAAFFLGLELLSVSLFALIAYAVNEERPLEAGIKYLILASVSSAFLLFGIALLYAALGTLGFAAMAPLLATDQVLRDVYVLAGLALITVGVGFKLSLVPFHMWTPDVYEGAPAPVTAFVATVSKGAVLAFLLRYFVEADAYRLAGLGLVLSFVAVASMLAGNLLALLQDNVKRLLAYSSIAHMGYALVAFLVGGELAVEAVSYYLVAYFVMTLGAFAVVTLLSAPAQGRELDDLADYRGLFWQRPWLAGAFTAMLLSLAGIPLTVGFIGKFYAFAAGVEAARWGLLATLVTGSAIGLFYYLRVIVVMYQVPPAAAPAAHDIRLSQAGSLVLAVLALLLVWLGVYPAPLMELIRTTALRLA
ncbi:NADH-quinone oxidoreductase subunit N [Thermithiobacillus tepidarius DSM 3134]|uniref:NADH-quinone oxidoreductase subunit N n=1 Tax=Thermithiobacillus tepidarius TaxID=929 RepID=UPI0003FAD990|nr:NADH-quinone oxidoreductase subunit N [Thermithiobacillus tepidarius]